MWIQSPSIVNIQVVCFRTTTVRPRFFQIVFNKGKKKKIMSEPFVNDKLNVDEWNESVFRVICFFIQSMSDFLISFGYFVTVYCIWLTSLYHSTQIFFRFLSLSLIFKPWKMLFAMVAFIELSHRSASEEKIKDIS